MFNIKPSFYAVIPATVRYCKKIEPMAKLLYAELTTLKSSNGNFDFDSKYLEELFEVDEASIQKWLDSLENEGFIEIKTLINEFGDPLIILIVL